MPKVVIAQDLKETSCRNYMRFGEPITVFSNADNKKFGLEPCRALAKAAEVLEDMAPEDCLLFSGNKLFGSVIASMYATKFNTLNLLLWSAKDNDYVYRTCYLNSLPIRSTRIGNPVIFVANNYTGLEDPTKLNCDVRYLTDGNYENPLEPEEMKDHMLKELKDSKANDRFLLSGGHAFCAIGSAILAKRHRTVNYLVWHLRAEKYLLRSVSFSQAGVLAY